MLYMFVNCIYYLCFGCNSLKRSGMAKGGFGPLIFLVSEGGLHYIDKFLNKQKECKDFNINTVFEQLFFKHTN